MKISFPKKHFYLIRHGETTANVLGKTSGIKDIDLTEKGIKQAENTALLFEALDLKDVTIFSSPLKRALKTAEIINQEKHEVIVLDQLMERDFGLWEGEEWTVILSKLENGIHPPKGETTLQHIERSLSAFTYILSASTSMKTTPLIVSHGGSFYTFGRFYNQKRIFSVGNCELYYFEPLPPSEGEESLFIPWKTWNVKFSSSNQVLYEANQLYTN
jgi:probable phosphoglycerate mutase